MPPQPAQPGGVTGSCGYIQYAQYPQTDADWGCWWAYGTGASHSYNWNTTDPNLEKWSGIGDGGSGPATWACDGQREGTITCSGAVGYPMFESPVLIPYGV